MEACPDGLGDFASSLVCSKLCRNSSDLYKALDKCQIGDIVDMEVLRESTKEHVKITLESSDRHAPA